MTTMTTTQRELLPQINTLFPKLSEFNKGFVIGLVTQLEQKDTGDKTPGDKHKQTDKKAS